MSHEEKTIKKERFGALIDTISGAMGGVGLVVAGHPFDTIKVMVQTSKATEKINIMNIVKDTFRKRGFFGFYTGALSPLIGNMGMNALVFLGYTSAARMIRPDGDVSKLPILQVAVCATFGGVLEALVESPQDLIKCKLQAGETKATGSITCFVDIVKRRGVFGLFQGLSSTVIRNIPGNICYFGAYEMSKRKFTGGDGKDANKTQIFIAGGLAGMAYWFFSYPLDMIKSIYQIQPVEPEKREYKNYMQTVRGVYSKYGARGLYRGFIPCMLRSFPSNAACFFMYEMTKKFLNGELFKKEEL